MSDGKDLSDSPPLGSNESGTAGAEKLGYDEEIGEDVSGEGPFEEDASEEEASAGEQSDPEASRRKRLKVTVRRPEALEELAERLGSSKAGVYNTALGMLAESMGVGSS